MVRHQRVPDHLPSLAERFADLGYATGYLGKVHYGPEGRGDRACPPHHRFAESWYGLAGQQMGRLNYLHHSREAVEKYGPEASWRMAVQPMLDGDEDSELEGFLTDEIGARARDFVARHEDEPFFLMVAFNAVHNFCFQLPEEELVKRGLTKVDDWDPSVSSASDYVDWYDGAIWPGLPDGREYYLAQLELMDAQIGRLLDELESRGLAEDTMVVYTTDNGGSTSQLRCQRTLARDEVHLVGGQNPGAVPGSLAAGEVGGTPGERRNDRLVSTLDLYPTLLSAAGADPSAWEHARRRRPAARTAGRAGRARARRCAGTAASSGQVRSGDWKLRRADDGPHAQALLRTEHAEVGVERPAHPPRRGRGRGTRRRRRAPNSSRSFTARHRAWQAQVGIG